jgi:hypothetical protein
MIFWVTVARRGVGKPAATLPFNRRPLGARREDYSGYTIEYWSSAELHPKTCPRRPVNTRGY